MKIKNKISALFLLVLLLFCTSCSKLTPIEEVTTKEIEIISIQGENIQIKNLYADWYSGPYERTHYIYEEVPDEVIDPAPTKGTISIGDIVRNSIKPNDLGLSGDGSLDIDFHFK